MFIIFSKNRTLIAGNYIKEKNWEIKKDATLIKEIYAFVCAKCS